MVRQYFDTTIAASSNKSGWAWGEKRVFFPRSLSTLRSPPFRSAPKPEPGTGYTKACLSIALFVLLSTGFSRFSGLNEK